MVSEYYRTVCLAGVPFLFPPGTALASAYFVHGPFWFMLSISFPLRKAIQVGIFGCVNQNTKLSVSISRFGFRVSRYQYLMTK